MQYTVQDNLQKRIFIPVPMHQNHPFDSTAKKVKKKTLFMFGRARGIKLNIKLSSNCLMTIDISCFDIYTKSNTKDDGMF